MNDNLRSRGSNVAATDSWTEIFDPQADEERFADVVSCLAKHFAEPVILTGSYAIEWHLRTKNGDARKRRLSDIDVVAASGLSGIDAGLGRDFLIHHYHPTRELGNVVMQLVEPNSRTRVDVFSPRSPSLRERISTLTIDGIVCSLVAAEDLAARLLAIVGIVLDGRTIDPKHFDSINRLIAVTDVDVAARLWSDYRRGNDPTDFYETLDAVKLAVAERPALLKPEEYSQDIDAKCPWCVESVDFPLAARSQIFELLGYV